MSAPVDPKAAEMWIAGLGMALVEMKDSEITALRAENEKLRAALHRISLGSQNSSTTKEDLGREARAVLENINAA